MKGMQYAHKFTWLILMFSYIKAIVRTVTGDIDIDYILLGELTVIIIYADMCSLTIVDPFN